MKAFISSITIFICLCIIVAVHTCKISKASTQILELSNRTQKYAETEQWQQAVAELDRITEIWNKNKLWAEFTLPTAINREIDFSLTRSHTFALLGQLPDFSGEFATFKSQIQYLLNRERPSPGEIF